MLKKILTASSMILLAGTLQAETNTATGAVAKDFSLLVEKSSNIMVEPTITESVDIEIEELTSLLLPADNDSNSGDLTPPPPPTGGTADPVVTIGEIAIETTANYCYASISTENNFELKGANTGATLAWYNINYKAIEDANYPAGSFNIFGANSAMTQPVSCGSAMLDFALLDVDNSVPEDNYDDVVRVVVTAES